MSILNYILTNLHKVYDINDLPNYTDLEFTKKDWAELTLNDIFLIRRRYSYVTFIFDMFVKTFPEFTQDLLRDNEEAGYVTGQIIKEYPNNYVALGYLVHVIFNFYGCIDPLLGKYNISEFLDDRCEEIIDLGQYAANDFHFINYIATVLTQNYIFNGKGEKCEELLNKKNFIILKALIGI